MTDSEQEQGMAQHGRHGAAPADGHDGADAARAEDTSAAGHPATTTPGDAAVDLDPVPHRPAGADDAPVPADSRDGILDPGTALVTDDDPASPIDPAPTAVGRVTPSAPAAEAPHAEAARPLPGGVAVAEPAADPAPAEPVAPPAVLARDLQLHGSRGPVYGPVDLEIATGTLTLVQGPQGAGRSSLLLTIAGRMTPDRGGRLTVLGEPLPRRRNAVQKRSAVACFDGIDDLDESVTVGDLARERLRWLSPWYRHTGRVSQQQFAELAAPVFGERPLPRVGSVVWDLDEVDRMLLRIALAMAQDPELLVVDDVDQVHDTERRRTVWARLEALAAEGLTVVAAIASLDEAARVPWSTPPSLVTLATGPHAIPA
ncbi:ATP-binding cassette domain-containing protein [Cellulomonas denverensis]|uniref:ATP-binding cassette domain-containing protein n=1 Tax=Cellulomonas denverensis TaxID=264297 RepID=UPI0035EC6675